MTRSTDSGALVLAIENRLGLKYLNGAREDHSGRLFEGVQGYQRADTPVTFSARELRALLAEAGFAAAEFLLPFPDYKLARTIVNPAACADEHRIHNWLAGPAPDRGAERGPLLYNESLAVREVAEAGLLTDLANSFLVVAFPASRDASEAHLGLDLGWAARHYSLDRRIGLRKRATLRGEAVEHEPAPFGDAAAVAERAAVAAFGVVHEPAPEPFRHGELQLLGVLGSLAGGELAGPFAAQVREHRAWLLERYGAGANDGPLPAVAGEAFDVTWWNVVVDPAGGTREVIDGEWRLTSPVPVDFVVWRMLHHFFLRHRISSPRRCGTSPSTSSCAARWTPPGSSRAGRPRHLRPARARALGRALPRPIARGSLRGAGHRRRARRRTARSVRDRLRRRGRRHARTAVRLRGRVRRRGPADAVAVCARR